MARIFTLFTIAAIGCAQTLILRTDCEANICTATEAFLSMEIDRATAGSLLKITVLPETGPPRTTIARPAAPGTWTTLLPLTPGRNRISVTSIDEARGLNASTVLYYQPNDARSTIVARAFFGISLDSFAASEWSAYINPDQNGKIKERGVGGISFDYRLLGDPAKDGAQLWLYGNATHGMRSAGVDCRTDTASGVCIQFDPAKPNRTLYLIRASTSLEATLGARWEFLTLQRHTAAPVAVYLKAQAGFLTVAGASGDLLDVHHAALGAIAKAGAFTGSHIEAGLGKTALFPGRDAFPRLKVNAYLQWPLVGGMTGFAMIVVDSNPHKGGADSVQSSLGVNFDLRGLF